MAEILLSAGKYATVDDVDFEWLSQWKWTYSGHGYVHRGDNGRKIYMHRLIAGWDRVDHIDGNGLNNQRSNLRPTSIAENGRNRGANRNNTSGYKGVFRNSKSTWSSRIVSDGKNKYLGSFKSKEEAALAYNEAALKYHGEFARLNVINS